MHFFLYILNCRVLAFKNYNDIGKSLHTFLKDSYIPEALLSHTNSNNWGKYLLQFLLLLLQG